MELAGKCHDFARQVDRFVTELGSSRDLAASLEEAVMHADQETTVRLLRDHGIDADIHIERLEADLEIMFGICAGVTSPGHQSCVWVSIRW
jgi:hypothetical protein